jgi:hypothetical protein
VPPFFRCFFPREKEEVKWQIAFKLWKIVVTLSSRASRLNRSTLVGEQKVSKIAPKKCRKLR